ncbi:TRAP transporter small permease [uncultured Lentibacter sp.]|jgi:TRAP-type C4-dicarboxylate transport system permease small subunit|uniref:TRAP transporter small permease n=1 Tax=uncultured Lentibacter sp. TaxID=1659309 RepID=UPI0026315C17|nr:TRAP transporter small permease subunit [uncultured Lentibacter sp.]
MLKPITLLARAMAVLGGLVLSALVVLTFVSVLGRGLNTLGHAGHIGALGDWLISTGVGPVTGDFELLEAGVAFAIFAFLPITQLYGAHATVDIFTSALPRRANRGLMAFWELVLTAAILLITARLYEGMLSKMQYGETTFLLQFPIWWAYAASLAAALAACCVALFCSFARLAELVTGRAFMPHSEGSSH